MSALDLSSLRDRIESVDRQIIALLAERLKIVEEVAAAKLASAAPLRDKEREELLLQRLRAQATAVGLEVVPMGSEERSGASRDEAIRYRVRTIRPAVRAITVFWGWSETSCHADADEYRVGTSQPS